MKVTPVYKMVPLAFAVALLAALPLSTCATRSTDRCRAAPAPTVALPRQRHAAQVALRMPLVRRLLARRRLNGTLLDVQANRQGALIGVRVRLTLQRPVERVDATWPWLLIDNSGTLHPPYQIIRMHVQPRLLWGVGVTGTRARLHDRRRYRARRSSTGDGRPSLGNMTAVPDSQIAPDATQPIAPRAAGGPTGLAPTRALARRENPPAAFSVHRRWRRSSGREATMGTNRRV
jgi:hypothetical protein